MPWVLLPEYLSKGETKCPATMPAVKPVRDAPLSKQVWESSTQIQEMDPWEGMAWSASCSKNLEEVSQWSVTMETPPQPTSFSGGSRVILQRPRLPPRGMLRSGGPISCSLLFLIHSAFHQEDELRGSRVGQIWLCHPTSHVMVASSLTSLR